MNLSDYMKINVKQGNIFESSAEAIVNPVNCKGAMGKGLAKDFKVKYPENFKAYFKACQEGNLYPGKIFTFAENKKTIYNFPTKDDWRNPSEYRYIELGLNALVVECLRSGIASIALPPLGCGLGGLDFGKVSILINRAFYVVPQLDVTIFIKENTKHEKILPASSL